MSNPQDQSDKWKQMACAVREPESVVYSNTVSMECDINIMTWTKNAQISWGHDCKMILRQQCRIHFCNQKSWTNLYNEVGTSKDTSPSGFGYWIGVWRLAICTIDILVSVQRTFIKLKTMYLNNQKEQLTHVRSFMIRFSMF